MPPPDAPTCPTGTFDKRRPGCVTVSWTAPASAPARYEVVAQPTLTVHTTKNTSLPVCGLEAGATYSFEICAVAADGTKSPPAKTDEIAVDKTAPSSLWWWSAWGIVLAFIAAAIATFVAITKHSTGHSLGYACGIVALGLALLSAIGGPYGFWRAIIGADGRVSTSYVTTAMWTVLLAFVLSYLAARTWFFHQQHLFDGLVEGARSKTATAWDDYLVLLGGPFAALVFARGIVSSKVQSQTVQKTLADDGTASLKQTLTDDGQNVDLVDSQYFLFNIVAFGYVIVAFAATNRLPAIPAILLALTSSSAATYVVNKAVQNQSPRVSGVVPSTFKPGERIVITGANFMPAGPDRLPAVTVGGKQAFVHAHATNGRIVAIAPLGAAAGTQDLVVITAARASTDAYPVRVTA